MSTPRRIVRTFKQQFAPLVESGAKRQTVRPMPKIVPRAGDLFDARQWTGLPYRSKQRKLGVWPIVLVSRVRITPDALFWGGDHVRVRTTDPMNLDNFARADGFANWSEMRDWFTAEHGLPFEGIVIYWAPASVSSFPSVPSVSCP